MRTSHLTCVALLVMLFATTTCLADTWSDAFASYSAPYEYDSDGHAFALQAWQPGTYYWSYSVTVSATAGIRGTDATDSHAAAYASAIVTVYGGGGASPNASASRAGVIDEGDSDYDEASNSDSVYMDHIGDVLYISESGWATATCGNPNSQAHARAITTSSGSIWQ